MKYCSQCGATVEWKIPDGDNFPRFVCNQCKTIHYQNPKIVTGCVVEHENKILLCKRAIEPRYGLWTLPAGFMENKEAVEQAAIRETWEEAHAKVTPPTLYAVFSLSHISQVYIMFRAHLAEPSFSAGVESLEVRLFDETEIPWDVLAFPIVRQTLLRYFQERKTGNFSVHVEDIAPITS
ncbi:NUDIX hydrolase [Beggiatoa leptomitoformis]|uniref:NUDIX domain-containing protein n=1 Tax=Beggiatoa leptomitoformis TaxID=288004 RepID=A0A2N9YBC0_9GAMM|nr:NUDIX hydrolase [Beggiatoa leptomitoformis]ALG66867.1 NUDIX domain-containing protein [Beggiatoa leptomitoformis]AUI67778.1 NUDIX domain-containing protein [Beggiatoa leptomitoformis]